MGDCVFCKMVAGYIPSDTVFETEDLIAFHDIHPQAPVHILVVPRRHISTLNDVKLTDAALIANMYQAAQQVAKQERIAEAGYRLVMNCNSDGGQTVFHIHLHLLGGRLMNWPPG